MSDWNPQKEFTAEALRREAAPLFEILSNCKELDDARRKVMGWISEQWLENKISILESNMAIHRDCVRALTSMIRPQSDDVAGFSVTQALWDLAMNKPRDDLQRGFYAEMIRLFQGIAGRAPYYAPDDFKLSSEMSGRQASLVRSDELDRIWTDIERRMSRFEDGLSEESRKRRAERKARILKVLGGSESDWGDWKWHVRHVLKDAEQIASVINIDDEAKDTIRRANEYHLPVGVTPFYASLMDEQASDRDRAVRAQVLPPTRYVDQMESHRDDRDMAFDFMGEHDTSPVDLVTRRYPAILILKPYNSCPQICVYCQRNWEIDEVMAPGAMAPQEKVDEAIDWIADHKAISEVLITGGDPLVMSDERIERIMGRLAEIDHLDLIRIGSRVLVTLPQRLTEKLASLLAKYRQPGKREVCVVTHIEHPYEINPDMVEAVDRLKRGGISVFNQQVYTFFTSRRFESARLRSVMRLIGIDPYYTFVAKGKDETADYRVPMARLLQERKEEVRLLPGIRRTDEVVYNVPRLGKNHVRAYQHRDLLAISADGERIYQFHPWEKNIVERQNYIGADVPILEYLERLAAIGEDPEDYDSIWYYF